MDIALQDENGALAAPRPPVRLKIGEPAPDFRLPDLSGHPLTLSDFRGGTTLVLFWRPGCGFCQRMLADLKAWEAQSREGMPRLLVVSTGSVQDNQSMGLLSPIVLDQEGLSVGRQFGAHGTPRAVLVDAQGKISSEVMAGASAVLALLGATPAHWVQPASLGERFARPRAFGIGLSRTGTLSLNEALNLLGYRSLHYPHDDVMRAELYRFFACRPASLHLSLLQEADALTDIPACCLYQALDRAYPGSKFILTVREKQSWLSSCRSFWKREVEPYIETYPLIQYGRMMSEHLYGSLLYEAECFEAAYDRYTAEVSEYFRDRPEDVLILDICGGQGWSELGPFLGAAIPPLLFPWEHRTQSSQDEE